MSLFLHKITLTQFRNYEAMRLDGLNAPMIVLTGPNGAGKTNVLEAISLLTPGRGMRGATLADFKNKLADPMDNWGVAADITRNGDVTRLGTGGVRDGKRRIVRVDGKDAKGQSALSNIMASTWLTPQMDRLFLEGRSARRKFLDRLVFSYQPTHATNLNRYEKNMRQRARILQEHKTPDPKWLSQLEKQLTEDMVMIAAERDILVEKLHQHMGILSAHEHLFPIPHLSLRGAVEDILNTHKAVDAEDILQVKMAENRLLDAQTGRTNLGTHRTDLSVVYQKKQMPADQCSTGEQKGLLISIVLAHAQMMKAEKGFVPVLLLDEVAAHLDENRRAQLFSILEHLGGQVWMTGTDPDIFKNLDGRAMFFEIKDGRVFPKTELKTVSTK